VLVSALSGEGVDTLMQAIENRLSRHRTVLELLLDPADGAGMSWLHRNTEVINKALDAQGHLAMTVRVESGKADNIRSRFAIPPGADKHL
jgi:GTP-binding protein HflX